MKGNVSKDVGNISATAIKSNCEPCSMIFPIPAYFLSSSISLPASPKLLPAFLFLSYTHTHTHPNSRLFSATEHQVDVFVAKVITAIWSTQMPADAATIHSHTWAPSPVLPATQISHNVDWQAVCRHQQGDEGQRLYSGGTSKEIVAWRLQVWHKLPHLFPPPPPQKHQRSPEAEVGDLFHVSLHWDSLD